MIDSSTKLFDNKINPAHVPKIGFPSCMYFLIGSIKSNFSAKRPIVVLSPPGILLKIEDYIILFFLIEKTLIHQFSGGLRYFLQKLC